MDEYSRIYVRGDVRWLCGVQGCSHPTPEGAMFHQTMAIAEEVTDGSP